MSGTETLKPASQSLPCEATDVEPAALSRPGIYYGWYMLPLSMAALVASSPGQTFGISIFNEPMRETLGLSHGQIAGAYTLGTIFGAVPISYIGHLMDRQGLRRTTLVVLSLFSLACLAAAAVTSWWMLLFVFFLLRMLGPGALGFTSGNTLSLWFHRRLGMVEGLRQLGMAVAMAVVPAVNLCLVENWGWRGAYAILGVGLWIVLFPLFYVFYRDRPEDLGQSLDGHSPTPAHAEQTPHASASYGLSLHEALHSSAFWIVTGGTAMFSLIHTAVFFCFVPILSERGLTGQHAAVTLVVFAASLAVAQLASGVLADRVRACALLVPGLAGLALSMWLLLSAASPVAAYVAGAAMGVSQGIYFGAAHPLWARYFGRRNLGKIRGILMTVNVAASSLGPLMAGTLRDVWGDFHWTLLIFAILPLPLTFLSLTVRPPQSAH